MPRHQPAPQPYRTPAELSGGQRRAVPVVIVGAGPIGLAAAIDLALHGVGSILVDDNNHVATGSRAICWAKRSLEILDRLGVGDAIVARGVTWQVGRLFHGHREVYAFDLLPEPGHKMPAFVNLQQYHVEDALIARAADFPDLIDIRWNNRVTAIAQDGERVTATIETPDGTYDLAADYLVACDGARSSVRNLLGLDMIGERFEERFLIADVEMKADFPSERWFWFEPPFHDGATALLHKQPDDIYRIDLQLGPDADPALERTPERVIPRIAKAVGGRPFTLDWVSVYSFQCRRLARLVHDRVIFAGDSAHVVSPFGARGGNGGLHDVDNLCWKLAAVVRGTAAADLLESYDRERVFGADENLTNSARTTRFMSPESLAEAEFRDAVLALARDVPFARRMVNSGRLSVPCTYDGLAGFGPDDRALPHGTRPGAACPDAPLADGSWLLGRLGGRFTLLAVGVTPPCDTGIATLTLAADGPLAERYGAGLYLIRPDQHVAARWSSATATDVKRACTAWIDTATAETRR